MTNTKTREIHVMFGGEPIEIAKEIGQAAIRSLAENRGIEATLSMEKHDGRNWLILNVMFDGEDEKEHFEFVKSIAEIVFEEATRLGYGPNSEN